MSTGTWNYTVDDSSSILTYLPHGDGGADNFIQNGWQPWYSGSDGFNDGGGNEAVGQSLHITSLPGASVALQFYGSGIYLYGTANSSYDIKLDNNVTSGLSADGDVLFAQTGLTTEEHIVNLTVRSEASANQQVSFDYAVIENGVQDGTIGAPVPEVYDNSNTTLQYSGNWTVDKVVGIPNATVSLPYHITKQLGSFVSMNFTGGVGIAINGTRNWGNWIYNVTLDSTSLQYNGSTMWRIDDALLYYTYGLDENSTHTLELIDTAGDGMQLSLNSITIFTPNRTVDAVSSNTSSGSPSAEAGSSSKSTSHVGVIVGVVVGVVGALAVAGPLYWWYTRRRNAAHVQPEEDPSVTPYLTASSAALAGMASRTTFLTEKDRIFQAGSAPQPAWSATSPSEITAETSTALMQSVAGTVPVAASQSAPSEVSTTQVTGVQPAPARAVDVDQLIDMIAQRLDQQIPGQTFDPHAPPPEYEAED